MAEPKSILRENISHILLNGTSFVLVLEGLLALKKLQNKNYSASVLAKKAGISRSYLSEVLAGKKKVSATIADSLGKSLGLTYLEMAYFEALVAFELAKTRESSGIALKNLEKCKKLLVSVNPEQAVPEGATLLAFDIYASVSMFGEKGGTLSEFKALFSKDLGLEVQKALGWLVSRKVLKLNGENYGYTSSGLVFSAKEGKMREDFWRAGIQESVHAIGISTNEESLFSVYSVSTQKDKIPAFVEAMKKHVLEKITELDSPNADTLLRFNIQIYPKVKRRERKGGSPGVD